MSQVIATLQDGLQEMSKFAGGTIPQTSDQQYADWVSWINQGQEDQADRGFWSRLLTSVDFDIVAGEPTLPLPDDFHKRNGIYVLNVNNVDWAEANNKDGQKLFVNIDEDSAWNVTFMGYVPTEDVTAKLWYFRHPLILADPTDRFVLDGKTSVFYALTEYFRQAGELGSLDDARAEYNNRFDELLSLEMLPTQQELLSFRSYYGYINQPTNERNFYTRNRNRSTRR